MSYKTSPLDKINEMSLKKKLTIGGSILGLLLGFIILTLLINWERVEGNERLVTQDFRTGVSPNLVGPGTYFYMPIKTSIYKYNIGTEKFIMGFKELYNGKGSDYVDYPPFGITTGGSGNEQLATFSITLQYRLDPKKLIELHNTAQSNYEDLVIKPALTRIISDQATTQTVLSFYSGEGRVNLQKNIEKAITESPALASVGIIVETFVFDDIRLDPNYVAEITGRQLATQQKLRAVEEAKAAEEIAKKVEAEAQADKLKKIVQAEASKQERIRAAEAAAEEVKLAAVADAAKVKAAADASRYDKEQNAKGLLAQGTAEAEVAQKKAAAKYTGEAGQRQADVEIAQARVELFKNMKIDGVVPEKTLMTLINGSSPSVNTTIPAAQPAPKAAE